MPSPHYHLFHRIFNLGGHLASPHKQGYEQMEKKTKPNLLRQLSGSSAGNQIWIDPYTKERVWVFNPMHIVNLTKQTKSRFVRIVEGFKNFSNRWFSHVLLLLFLILYGFLGAYIFVTLEAPIEAATKVCSF